MFWSAVQGGFTKSMGGVTSAVPTATSGNGAAEIDSRESLSSAGHMIASHAGRPERARSLRILLVTEYSPFAEKSFGAQQRSLLLWSALGKAGDVDILLLRPGSVSETLPVNDSRVTLEASYRNLLGGLHRYKPDRALTRAIDGKLNLSRYDLICSRHLQPISKIAVDTGQRVIVDLDDACYIYSSHGSRVRRAVAAVKGLVRRRMVRAAMRRFDRFWFVSDRDRAAFPDVQGDVLPNVPMARHQLPPSDPGSRALLFVGALWYGPNVEAVDWFLAKVWPVVRAAVTGSELIIVGGGPRERLERWSCNPGVRAVGFVDDVVPVYEQCAFTIVPIHSGGGTNIKLLESLALGRTCVTTPFCARAFAPRLWADQHFLAADDRGFARDCIRLLNDPTYRELLASQGGEAVRQHFGVDRFEQAVLQQVELALKTPSKERRSE